MTSTSWANDQIESSVVGLPARRLTTIECREINYCAGKTSSGVISLLVWLEPLIAQASHLICGLPRFLQPLSQSLFRNIRSFVLITHHVLLIKFFIIFSTWFVSVPFSSSRSLFTLQLVIIDLIICSMGFRWSISRSGPQFMHGSYLHGGLAVYSMAQ